MLEDYIEIVKQKLLIGDQLDNSEAYITIAEVFDILDEAKLEEDLKHEAL